MLRRAFVLLFAAALAWSPVPSLAATVDDLSRALRLPELFTVLREEGIAHGADLEEELFPGAGGPRWEALVAAIHATGRMEQLAMGRMTAELADRPEALERMVAYFAGDPGARIIALELAARMAFLDDAVKDAAEVAYQDRRAADDDRLRLVGELVVANDLIEQNVAGALNANLAFYKGLLEGGAPSADIPEAEMMADLWAQEPMIRTETESWLMSYLLMAYQPLTDAELESYIAFSRTAEGQLLNRALFAAFDQVFDTLSRDLGLAAARFLGGQDL